MADIKSKYILEDGLLNESLVENEFRSGLAQLIESSRSESDEKSGSRDNFDSYIYRYLERVTNNLNTNNCAKLIPNMMTIVLQTVKSLGIDRISLNTSAITNIISLLKPEERSAKRNKSKDKRKIVLDAAMVVFARNGFHETHVDQIAEFAGVAKGTVYRYFKSKEDILKEIIKANNETLTNELRIIFNKDGHILELIKEAIAYYVEFFDNNKDLYKILTHSPWILKDISDHFYKNIISHLNIVRKRVFNLTREGIVKPTDFYTVFYGIFGFIDGVIQKWFRRNCEYSLKDELPVIIEVLYYGFVSEGERKTTFI